MKLYFPPLNLLISIIKTLGRCSLEQKKHTDTCQVIWIATSNLGQKLIAEHVQQWKQPDGPPSRNEYIQLATAIRRSISEVLGVWFF